MKLSIFLSAVSILSCGSAFAMGSRQALPSEDLPAKCQSSDSTAVSLGVFKYTAETREKSAEPNFDQEAALKEISKKLASSRMANSQLELNAIGFRMTNAVSVYVTENRCSTSTPKYFNHNKYRGNWYFEVIANLSPEQIAAHRCKKIAECAAETDNAHEARIVSEWSEYLQCSAYPSEAEVSGVALDHFKLPENRFEPAQEVNGPCIPPRIVIR